MREVRESPYDASLSHAHTEGAAARICIAARTNPTRDAGATGTEQRDAATSNKLQLERTTTLPTM